MIVESRSARASTPAPRKAGREPVPLAPRNWPGRFEKTLRRLLPLLLMVILLAGADDPTPTGSTTVPSDPIFTALLIDASTVSGRIRQFGPGGKLTLVGERSAERIVALDQLVKLTRDGATPPTLTEGSIVLFPDGDRLRSTTGTSGDEAVELQSYALGDLKVSLDRPLGLVLTMPTDPEALDALLARVREEPRKSEVLWLANGDRMAGGFLGLGTQKLTFQTETGKVELDRAGVVALGFDPALVNYPKPKGPYLELTLADGSRLGVSGARVERGHIVALARLGPTIRVPIAELAQVHVLGGPVEYLSDRADAVAFYESYVGPTRPYRRDATVDGHPLRLAGQVYDRGLGTQSRTLLAYKLRPSDHRVQAIVGLDDRAGPLGNAVFRVLVDKRVAFVSPPMSARDTPRSIDIDVSGARSLILVTEFGERGEVRDLADWIEARLIR